MGDLKKRLHYVYIQGVPPNPKAGTYFEAYLKENIQYELRMFYDTLFREFIDWRNIISKMAVGAGMLMPSLESITKKFNDFIYTQGISWTKKFGGIPEHITFTIPCRIWVENGVEDITEKLSRLYDIAVPTLGALFTSLPQHTVMVRIGDWFELSKAYITRIWHDWSETMVEKVPLWCNLLIDVTTVYVVDRSQLAAAGPKIFIYGEPMDMGR